MKTYFKLLAFAPGLLAAPAAVAGIIVSAPVDVIRQGEWARALESAVAWR